MSPCQTGGILTTPAPKVKDHSTASPPRGSLFDSYVKHLERRARSPRTLETYGECLRAFGRFLAEAGGKSPLDVSASDLMGFQVWLNHAEKRNGGRFSAAYRSTHVTVVRGLYRWLHSEGLVPDNPAKRLRLPKVGKHLFRNVLNAQEIRLLISQPDDSREGLRDRVVLRFLALSGPRVSELAGLDVCDVSLANREMIIRRGKGAKDRLVFFDKSTSKHLARYLARARLWLAGKRERALIVDRKGRRIKPFQLREIVRRHTRSAGIDKAVTCHSLRHAFCTNLLRAGANLKAIAELVGHASLETTSKYTRVDIADLSAVYQTAHPLARSKS